jgi:hypothetical protein
VFGGVLMAVAYLASTILLGCWSRGDIEHLQQLYRRFVPGQPRLGTRLLDWAHDRAPGEGTP